MRFIAKLTRLSTGNAYFLSILFNFAVMAGIIFWAARKYLPGAFSARTAAIQKAMQEAQKASEEARRRLAEIESRLMKLDVEIGMMRDSAEKDAEAEEARIQAAAAAERDRLLEQARREIALQVKVAERELVSHAAELAVGVATERIKKNITDEDQQRLVDRYVQQLGSAPNQ